MLSKLASAILFAAIGITLIAVGFAFGQDLPENKDMKWYEVLRQHLLVRGMIWGLGLIALFSSGFIHFKF